jgi:hypothetical protein
MLMGCEQAVINGPVGGATVTVTELHTGAEIAVPAPEMVTDDLDDAMARWAAFDDFVPLQVLGVLGIAILNALPVDENTWYLVTMEGGFDYAGHPDTAPVQVFGKIHAIMTGAQLNRGGFVVGPLSEAAYQWLRPWLDSLSDAELAAALQEYTEQLVTDIRDVGEQLDYDDLLTYNHLLHTEGYIGSGALFAAMQAALSAGDGDAAKLSIAEDLASASAPRAAAEAVFADNISPNISQLRCSACHVAGGIAGATRHVLQRPNNNNHIALNVAMYANLVDAIGVNQIVLKARGGVPHGGGAPLAPGSQQLADLEAFLKML